MHCAVRMSDKTLIACILMVWAATGCSVSQDQEVAIGRQNAEDVNAKLPIVTDAVAADYVQQLGLAMAQTTSRSELDWRFFIVDSKEVNAFALPGGFIYVNRGLIERAQELDELAGAIGHEIGHVVRRHSVHQMNRGRRPTSPSGWRVRSLGCATATSPTRRFRWAARRCSRATAVAMKRRRTRRQ